MSNVVHTLSWSLKFYSRGIQLVIIIEFNPTLFDQFLAFSDQWAPNAWKDPWDSFEDPWEDP